MNVLISSQCGLSTFIYSFNAESPHSMGVITYIQYMNFYWMLFDVDFPYSIKFNEFFGRVNADQMTRLPDKKVPDKCTCMIQFELSTNTSIWNSTGHR